MFWISASYSTRIVKGLTANRRGGSLATSRVRSRITVAVIRTTFRPRHRLSGALVLEERLQRGGDRQGRQGSSTIRTSRPSGRHGSVNSCAQKVTGKKNDQIKRCTSKFEHNHNTLTGGMLR
jgi:hypothetical protein